jgi:hypothetical protein
MPLDGFHRQQPYLRDFALFVVVTGPAILLFRSGYGPKGTKIAEISGDHTWPFNRPCVALRRPPDGILGGIL